MRRRTYLGGVAAAALAGCLGSPAGSTDSRCPQFDAETDRVVCDDDDDPDVSLEPDQDRLTTEPDDETVETLPIRLENRTAEQFAPAAWRLERTVDDGWRTEIHGTVSTDAVGAGESHVWAVSREAHPTLYDESRTALAVGSVPDGDYVFAVVGLLGETRVETHARFELRTT